MKIILVVPGCERVHLLFPACIPMENQCPLMTVRRSINFLCNQLITIFGSFRHFLSSGTFRPFFSFFPSLLFLLFYIIRLYQRFHAVFCDSGKSVQFLHGRWHQSRTHQKISCCQINEEKQYNCCNSYALPVLLFHLLSPLMHFLLLILNARFLHCTV